MSRLSTEDVVNQGRTLLVDFIQCRLEKDAIPNPPNLSHLKRPRGPPLDKGLEIGRLFQRGADKMKDDRKLQVLIDELPLDAECDSLSSVLSRLFSDGQCPWGRIITVFYVGYSLTVEALSCQPSMIQSIVDCIVNFIRSRIAGSILAEGGWESVLDLYSIWNWKQLAGVWLVAGVALALVCFVLVRGRQRH